MLRHRTACARTTSAVRQDFLVQRKGSCVFYLSKRNGSSGCLFSSPARTGGGEDIVAASVRLASACLSAVVSRRFSGCRLMSRTRNTRWAWGPCAPDVRFQSVLSQDMHDRRARCGFSRASPASSDGCYLVDPASSHMLVSKIKPCMCKYEPIQTVKLRMAH